MNVIKSEKYASSLFNDIASGKNSYMRIDRLESSNFDMVWINEIENCLYDLGDIIANPREVTKTVTNIVPVELARKTGAESVIHLASHSQYVKEITEKGDVVPNKILSLASEEDIHTYENRFIATLVRRLVLFIEKRYEFVKKFSILHDEEVLYVKNKSIVDGSEVEIETKIKIKSLSDSKLANISNRYVERIKNIRDYVMFFYGSKFMKDLKTERDVRNPIVMTNILRKNPKYNHCYRLFKFIERYDRLGVSYKVDEDVSEFNEEELNELNILMFTNYLALKAKDRSKQLAKQSTHVYKPRILSSLEDEPFIYGDILKGPVEFVRVDQGYQEYLDSLVKQDLPVRPTKVEKEYFAEEIEEKNKRKSEKAALDKLEKRKKKEQLEHEKRVKAVIAQREKEEAERIAKEKEAARLAEEERIEAIRKALVEDAMSAHSVEEQFVQPAEEPVEEVPVEEPTEEVVAEEEPAIEEPVQEVEEEPMEVASEEQITETEDNGDQLVEEVIEETPVEEETPHIEEVIQEEIPTEEEIVIEEPVDEPAPIVEEEVQPEIEDQPVEQENIPEEEVSFVPAEEVSVEDIQPVEEPVIEEEKPAKKVKSPRKRKAKKEEIVPAIDEQPQEQETPVEEQPVVEEPVVQETEPIQEPVKKERKPRKPKAKKEPVVVPVEETPVEEETPVVEEPTEEVIAEEEPVIEEPAQEVEEEPVEQLVEEQKPKRKGLFARKKPKEPKEKKVKEKKKTKEKPVEKLEKIPGRFIVKNPEGYFVSNDKWSIRKEDARVFDDFNKANAIKKQFGGKVVKL